MIDRHEGLTKARLSKVLAVALCILVSMGVTAGYVSPKAVTVLVDDSRTVTETVYKTTAQTVETFLAMHEIDYDPEADLMDTPLETEIEEGLTLRVTKAFPVTIQVDGKEIAMTTLPITAGALLTAAGIVTDENDLIEPAPDTALRSGDTVTVTRVIQATEQYLAGVAYDTYTVADPSIPIGDVQLIQKGRTGLVRKTYDVTYMEGEETSRELIQKETLIKKRDKIYGYGTKILTGKPAGLTYTKKYDNVRAYAYHVGGNPHGSYGLPCTYGTVAVDPDLIPLGSLLYIEGYGYATANDVGSAVQGKVVDLYMEKQQQALMWGARYTTVYVIREG